MCVKGLGLFPSLFMVYIIYGQSVETMGMKAERCNSRGFTLIELIAVLVIVGVISVAAVGKFMSPDLHAPQAARDQTLLCAGRAAAGHVPGAVCARVAQWHYA